MKKLLLTTAIAVAMGSTVAFAHHPAEEFVDPVIYEMIDNNVSDVHADMIFDDDMGGDTTEVGSARESIASDVGNAGMETGGDLEDVGAEYAGDIDVEAATESREENNSMADAEPQVENSMADAEPSGSANGQR